MKSERPGAGEMREGVLAGVAGTEALARMLAERWGVAAGIIGLQGPVGAGKSEFARAFIRAWVEQPGLVVPSPGFTLAESYEGRRGRLLHVDLYRLEDAEEVLELGLLEWACGALCLVEWADRLPEQIEWPVHAWLFLSHAGDTEAEDRRWYRLWQAEAT